MFNVFKNIKNFVVQLTNLIFVLFCLGIILQLVIGEPILGWDVVGNVNKSVKYIGSEHFSRGFQYFNSLSFF